MDPARRLIDARRITRTFHLVVLIAVLVFLCCLLYLTLNYYLIPVASHGPTTSPVKAHRVVAYSRLVLALSLLIVLVGGLLLYRISRLIFPRKPVVRTKTQYVDAWAEAGKRKMMNDE